MSNKLTPEQIAAIKERVGEAKEKGENISHVVAELVDRLKVAREHVYYHGRTIPSRMFEEENVCPITGLPGVDRVSKPTSALKVYNVKIKRR